ncbi:MAG: hypothetical protein J6M05_01475 [Cardiobacteriaceae bacterium]|nr:hypothetical protein [Cardiobacteriaceae bacterium]
MPLICIDLQNKSAVFYGGFFVRAARAIRFSSIYFQLLAPFPVNSALFRHFERSEKSLP